MGNDGAAGQEHAEQIDVQGAPPFFERHGFGGAHGAVNAGVEDEGVQRAEFLERKRDQTIDLGFVGDIAGLGEDFLAGKFFGKFGAGGGQFFFAAGAEDDVRAFAQEMFGDDFAETLAAAGDEGVEIFEFHVRRHGHPRGPVHPVSKARLDRS